MAPSKKNRKESKKKNLKKRPITRSKKSKKTADCLCNKEKGKCKCNAKKTSKREVLSNLMVTMNI